MRFEYTAKRNLATGHTVDTNYEIVIYGWTIEPRFNAVGPENVSLDGTLERELYRIDTEYRVQTDAIDDGQDLENFEEFLHSVMGGESFTFDPDSDVAASAVNPLTCILKSRRLSRVRVSPLKFQFTFDVRTVP